MVSKHYKVNTIFAACDDKICYVYLLKQSQKSVVQSISLHAIDITMPLLPKHTVSNHFVTPVNGNTYASSET